MNAPNPVFDDWSEYEISENRNRGFLARIMASMWAYLAGALWLAACLTALFLVVQYLWR